MKIEDQKKVASRIAIYVERCIRKGEAFSLRMARPGKLRKAFDHLDIVCESQMSCQNTDYAKRKTVAQAVLKGLRNPPRLPSWVKYYTVTVNGLKVKFWQHKDKGTIYFPFPLFNSGNAKWKIDGHEVSKDSLREYLLGEEFKEKPSKEELDKNGWAPFRTPKVENITEIV